MTMRNTNIIDRVVDEVRLSLAKFLWQTPQTSAAAVRIGLLDAVVLTIGKALKKVHIRPIISRKKSIGVTSGSVTPKKW